MSLVRASLRVSRLAGPSLSPPLATARLHTGFVRGARNVSSTAGRRATVVATGSAAESISTAGASTSSGSGSSSSRMRYGLGLALVPVGLAAGAAYLLRPSEPAPGQPSIASVPTSSLLRAYAVYTICSFPTVIDAAPTLLHAFTHSPIPGLKALTEFIVRHTFFDQFVAGENVSECIASMRDMHARGVGGVLNYSAESELGDGLDEVHRAAEARNYLECKNAIEALGEYERQIVASGGTGGTSSFAIKFTGLIDPAILERASTSICRLRPLDSAAFLEYAEAPFPGVPQSTDSAIAAPQVDNLSLLPSVTGAIQPTGILATDQGVTDADMAALHEFWGRLRALATRSRDLGVKLVIDAEHAATQPIMDAMTLVLSREFNRPLEGAPSTGPIVFGTYQSYLRRAPYLLDWAIADSEKHGYALGIKIVRGAYFVSERKKWAVEGRSGLDPIFPNKEATDNCYNTSVEKITSTLARQLSGPNPETALSVFFATHNPQSVETVLSSLKKNGLAEFAPPSFVGETETRLRLRDDLRSKVFVAQLYGMRDDLTDRVVDSFEPGSPIAVKYIAYGQLSEVLPFLARRAIENKSIMTGEGGAAVERKRVTDELWRRLRR